MLEWVAISFSGDLPDARIKPNFPVSPALQVDSLLAEPLGEAPKLTIVQFKKKLEKIHELALSPATPFHISQWDGIGATAPASPPLCLLCARLCTKASQASFPPTLPTTQAWTRRSSWRRGRKGPDKGGSGVEATTWRTHTHAGLSPKATSPSHPLRSSQRGGPLILKPRGLRHQVVTWE